MIFLFISIVFCYFIFFFFFFNDTSTTEIYTLSDTLSLHDALPIGVGVNPGAVELDRELSRFHWKVDAGAEFAVTQPVFDVRQLESFLKRVDAYRIPIVAGIWPLISLRNAEFLANEVPGVVVPAEVLDRMRRAQDK